MILAATILAAVLAQAPSDPQQSAIALPASATADSTAAAPAAAPQRPRRICESRAPTGSRLERRICYTPEQYAALMAAKRKEAEELANGANIQHDSAIPGIGPL